MTAFVVVRLWCDHRGPPAEGMQFGGRCDTEFSPPPDLGFIKSMRVMRREAAKAGWTYVRYPNRKLADMLDKDYCPAHKPAATTSEGTEDR